MALPPFSNFQSVWIEKTKASHEHGGPGWEFGSCLWSPAANATGHKIYEDMRLIAPNDLILHFYEDDWFGNQAAYHYCGFSLAAHSCTVRTDEPPKPGEWGGRGEYYRVNLKGFTPFEETIPVEDIIGRHKDALVIIASQPKGPFILYQGSPRLAQGKYLSRCSPELYACLSSEVHEPLGAPIIDSSNKDSRKEVLPDAEAHEEFLEGQRQRREAAYFLRDRTLVARAKATYGAICQVCGFDFTAVYGPLGSGFIECHHLNPLSERYKTSAAKTHSNLKDVSVLCSNCHRMIHRMMRKEKRWIALDELKKVIELIAVT